MKSILDPTFRYTKSVDTDLKKTFARIRRAQRKPNDDPPSGGESTSLDNVIPMRRQRH